MNSPLGDDVTVVVVYVPKGTSKSLIDKLNNLKREIEANNVIPSFATEHPGYVGYVDLVRFFRAHPRTGARKSAAESNATSQWIMLLKLHDRLDLHPQCIKCGTAYGECECSEYGRRDRYGRWHYNGDSHWEIPAYEIRMCVQLVGREHIHQFGPTRKKFFSDWASQLGDLPPK